MLHEMGIDTGIDLAALLACARRAQEILGRPLGSHTLVAGPVDWRLRVAAPCLSPRRAVSGCVASPLASGPRAASASPPRSTPARRPPSRASARARDGRRRRSRAWRGRRRWGSWRAAPRPARRGRVQLDRRRTTRLTRPMRAPRRRRSLAPVMISSLARPEPDDGGQAGAAADVGDDPELDLREAELGLARSRRAGRSRARPPGRRRRMPGGSGRRPAWPSLRRGWRSRGTPCGMAAGHRSPAKEASSPRSTPAENTGPSPRSTTQCTAASARGLAQGAAKRDQQLLVHRVALLGAIQDDVADGVAVLGEDEAHGGVLLIVRWVRVKSFGAACRVGDVYALFFLVQP